jgi:hypothetical protein
MACDCITVETTPEVVSIETTTLDEVIEVGVVGPQGPTGATGAGVPTGGITGYALVKKSNTDYDTEWSAITSGFDAASPPPIGNVAPNAGFFTTISASGLATLPHIHGSLAGNLYVHVKNTSGGALSRGTPVYIVGNVGASDRVEVAAADYDDPTKMPALGLLDQDLAQNGEGDAVIVGELRNADTSAYSLNTELYVGNNGTLTATQPINPPAIIQTVGIVSRVQSNTGIIVVNMQGERTPAEQALEYREAYLYASGNYDVAQGRRTYLRAYFVAGASTYTVTLPRKDTNDNAQDGDELYVLLQMSSLNSNCIFRQYQYTGSLPYLGSFSTILDVPNASGVRLFRFRLSGFVWGLEPIYNMSAPPSIGEVTPNAGYFSPLYAVDSDGIGNGRVQLSADGVASGATRIATFPDKNITLDDSSDARTPTAHAESHEEGNTDPIQTGLLQSVLGNTTLQEDLDNIDGVLTSLGSAAFVESDQNLATTDTPAFASVNADVNASTVQTNTVLLVDNNTWQGTLTLGTDNLNANQSYQFPNESGTVALLSNLPSKTDVYLSNAIWTKPAGAKLIEFLLIGGGGGGGAGRRGATSTARGGGGGGSGAGIAKYILSADYFPTTVTVAVGAGGAGAVDSANDTNGANGTFGGLTILSIPGNTIIAYGGERGNGGTTTAGGTGGTNPTASSGIYNNSVVRAAGGNGGITATAANGTLSTFAPTGGGGGGGINASNVNFQAGTGGSLGVAFITNILGGARGAAGLPAGDGNPSFYNGSGTGGAGGRSDSTIGVAGGNGAIYGGGGGGGSAALNDGGGSTAGGNGGNGIAIITTYF